MYHISNLDPSEQVSEEPDTPSKGTINLLDNAKDVAEIHEVLTEKSVDNDKVESKNDFPAHKFEGGEQNLGNSPSLKDKEVDPTVVPVAERGDHQAQVRDRSSDDVFHDVSHLIPTNPSPTVAVNAQSVAWKEGEGIIPLTSLDIEDRRHQAQQGDVRSLNDMTSLNDKKRTGQEITESSVSTKHSNIKQKYHDEKLNKDIVDGNEGATSTLRNVENLSRNMNYPLDSKHAAEQRKSIVDSYMKNKSLAVAINSLSNVSKVGDMSEFETLYKNSLNSNTLHKALSQINSVWSHHKQLGGETAPFTFIGPQLPLTKYVTPEAQFKKLNQWRIRQKIAKELRVRNVMKLHRMPPYYRVLLNKYMRNKVIPKAYKNANAIKYEKVGNGLPFNIWQHIYKTVSSWVGRKHQRNTIVEPVLN